MFKLPKSQWDLFEALTEIAQEGKGPGRSMRNMADFDRFMGPGGGEPASKFDRWYDSFWAHAEDFYGLSPRNRPDVDDETLQKLFKAGVDPIDATDELFGQGQGYMEESRSSNSGKGKKSSQPEKDIVKRDWEKAQAKSSRASSKHSRMSGDKEPSDDMFFGSPDESDAEAMQGQPAKEMDWDDYAKSSEGEGGFGTITAPESPDDEFKGAKVHDYDPMDPDGHTGPSANGNAGEEYDYTGLEPGMSMWNQRGHREGPGAEVTFPGEADPDERPDLFGPPSGYWGTRDRKQYEPPPPGPGRGDYEMQGVGKKRGYRVVDRDSGKVLGVHPDEQDAMVQAFGDVERYPLIDVEPEEEE